MEEDIERLEKIVKLYYKCAVIEEGFDMGEEIIFMRKDAQALENLIKGYRELVEENRIFALSGSNITLKHHIENNYIPKSKVKEKIEELKGYRDLAKEQIEERVIIADSDSLNYGRAEAHNKDIEVLQELMEDK